MADKPRDVEFTAEQLSVRVEAFLARRYPEVNLQVLTTGLMHDEQMMARGLYDYRKAAGWPNPSVIGTERCVSCHREMHDESSACEDETVCRNCAPCR